MKASLAVYPRAYQSLTLRQIKKKRTSSTKLLTKLKSKFKIRMFYSNRFVELTEFEIIITKNDIVILNETIIH